MYNQRYFATQRAFEGVIIQVNRKSKVVSLMAVIDEVHTPDAREAEENLRAIRELMERSTRFSTFSGLSGIMAGCSSIGGCFITLSLQRMLVASAISSRDFKISFLLTWSAVIFAAISVDYLLTKRRAPRVGKRILSRLGKQMVIGSGPGLGSGALLTLMLLQHNLVTSIFPTWMLCYGCAVSAVGLFSQREVLYLGLAFLVAGAVTLALPPGIGLLMVGVTFGGFHIAYGTIIARKDGW